MGLIRELGTAIVNPQMSGFGAGGGRYGVDVRQTVRWSAFPDEIADCGEAGQEQQVCGNYAQALAEEAVVDFNTSPCAVLNLKRLAENSKYQGLVPPMGTSCLLSLNEVESAR